MTPGSDAMVIPVRDGFIRRIISITLCYASSSGSLRIIIPVPNGGTEWATKSAGASSGWSCNNSVHRVTESAEKYQHSHGLKEVA